MSGLERVTAMIVEDNVQVRNLVVSVLRQVGVGNILRANNGLEAIETFKEIRNNPAKVGVSEVDIVDDYVGRLMAGYAGGAYRIGWDAGNGRR